MLIEELAKCFDLLKKEKRRGRKGENKNELAVDS
jgi:hypothetical protein